MEYKAIAKNIKVSPRKMRLVADGVKKQGLNQALFSLTVMNKRASNPLKKAIDAAVANAVNNFKADKASLSIKDIMITEGLAMKRFHFAARGRVRPYKRRSSHITVVLTDGTRKIVEAPKVEEVKQIEAPSASSGQVKTEKKDVKKKGAKS